MYIYAEEGLMSRGAALCAQWEENVFHLRDLPHVIDIRVIGLVAGIELESRPGEVGRRAYDVFVDCFQHGLLIRVTGDTIALSPPLIVEPSHIDAIVTLLGEALRRAK
jgi:beta-alanine--pyruvate transaminase